MITMMIMNDADNEDNNDKNSPQDHLYVQYVELYQFQNEFRELSNKFSENEKIIKKLIVTGANIEEVK